MGSWLSGKDAAKRPTNVRNVRRTSLRSTLASGWSNNGQRLAAWWRAQGQPVQLQEDVEESSPSRVPWLKIFGVTAALVCLALLVMVAMSLGDYTATTQQLHVAEFQVHGNKRVTKESIVGASGVKPGSSLMAIDPHAVAQTLQAMPWIRSARVQPLLPSILSIEVQEYEPFALLLGKQLTIVDKNGYVFKVAEDGEAGDLPILTGLPSDLIRAGTTVGQGEVLDPTGGTPTRRKLRDLLRLIEAHAASNLSDRFPLSEIHYDPVLGTTLISAKDGAEVRLGQAMLADLPRAFTQIGRLLDRVEQRGEWLKYALLDDDVRSDRAVVMAVPLGSEVPVDGAKAGGASTIAPPGGSPSKDSKNKPLGAKQVDDNLGDD